MALVAKELEIELLTVAVEDVGSSFGKLLLKVSLIRHLRDRIKKLPPERLNGLGLCFRVGRTSTEWLASHGIHRLADIDLITARQIMKSGGDCFVEVFLNKDLDDCEEVSVG